MANAHCQGPPLLCLGTVLGHFGRRHLPLPLQDEAKHGLGMLAWLSGSGTFAVHFGEQLAQWPLHLPGAVDEGGHHPEQLVLVLFPDHGDGLQDELHLLQLVSPWGARYQMVMSDARVAGVCESPRVAPGDLQGQHRPVGAALGWEPGHLRSDLHCATNLLCDCEQVACHLWGLALSNVSASGMDQSDIVMGRAWPKAL